MGVYRITVRWRILYLQELYFGVLDCKDEGLLGGMELLLDQVFVPALTQCQKVGELTGPQAHVAKQAFLMRLSSFVSVLANARASIGDTVKLSPCTNPQLAALSSPAAIFGAAGNAELVAAAEASAQTWCKEIKQVGLGTSAIIREIYKYFLFLPFFAHHIHTHHMHNAHTCTHTHTTHAQCTHMHTHTTCTMHTHTHHTCTHTYTPHIHTTHTHTTYTPHIHTTHTHHTYTPHIHTTHTHHTYTPHIHTTHTHHTYTPHIHTTHTHHTYAPHIHTTHTHHTYTPHIHTIHTHHIHTHTHMLKLMHK